MAVVVVVAVLVVVAAEAVSLFSCSCSTPVAVFPLNLLLGAFLGVARNIILNHSPPLDRPLFTVLY